MYCEYYTLSLRLLCGVCYIMKEEKNIYGKKISQTVCGWMDIHIYKNKIKQIYCALASGFIVILSTTRDPHKNVK